MAHNTHPKETERRILDSARRLFTEKGYEKTSIQDILNDLGLSKGGLYHHFKSKEAILDQLNADEWAVTARLLDELIERDDMSALEKLRALIISAVDAPDHLDLVRSQLALLKDPAFFTANMRFWSTGLPESFRSLIDMGVQDGSIPTAYPEEAAQLLSLLGNYWLMPCFYPADRTDMERRIRCLATMLDAIGVPVFDETLILRAVKGLTALTTEGEAASA
ncbi:AcrR family transcriptional regulator [Bifidobacterium goeldii]|uniref:AcrR family transcriptional regulator n=1 Tax=Bifidobacterium goeldii TaxID=2306975 RepID=A0A430FMF6_9BIFI|nr:TetR/AcrR family transcriptional regulator [Bifidobacterium goeldii]RSX54089.1 AcrR family transcriptional regulator [Bifidobacterium goeldii]